MYDLSSVTDLEVQDGLEAENLSKCIWIKRKIQNIEKESPTPGSVLHDYIGKTQVMLIKYLSVTFEVRGKEIWLGSITKAPIPTENPKTQSDNTKRHQKFRLLNDCGPT